MGRRSFKTYFLCDRGKKSRKGKEWSDMGIGFGISNLISQYVYDSGEFIAIEDKEEIKEAIEKQRAFFWKYKGDLKAEELQEKATQLEADYVFLGEVKKCKKYRKKAFIGIVSKYQTKIRVFFTLHMVNRKNGEKLFSKGEGFAEKGASSVFFEVVDGEIDFNSSMVGMATEQAVEDAVEKIIKLYQSTK